MKRVKQFLVLGSWFLVALCASADSVSPASCTTTNFRNEAQAYVSGNSYWEGTTLLLTNCVLYSGGDTSSPVQGLAGVAIQARVGLITTNTPYTGNVQVASNGTWWVSLNVPTNTGGSLFLQVKLTDAATNSYIYPWKMIRTMVPLQ